jgi:hypothetical protein
MEIEVLMLMLVLVIVLVNVLDRVEDVSEEQYPDSDAHVEPGGQPFRESAV